MTLARRLRRLRHLLPLAAVACACGAGAAVGGCVDGQTPNCSDAAAGCGPGTDGASFEEDGAVDTDAGDRDTGVDAPADSPNDSTQPDAPVDAPSDTGGDVHDAKAG